MKLGGMTITEIMGILTFIGVLFGIFRGIITKSDCKDCKTDIDSDFKSGSEEFKKVRQVQVDQGKQLASIGATVTGMASNVDKLVAHHIGGGE